MGISSYEKHSIVSSAVSNGAINLRNSNVGSTLMVWLPTCISFVNVIRVLTFLLVSAFASVIILLSIPNIMMASAWGQLIPSYSFAIRPLFSDFSPQLCPSKGLNCCKHIEFLKISKFRKIFNTS